MVSWTSPSTPTGVSQPCHPPTLSMLLVRLVAVASALKSIASTPEGNMRYMYTNAILLEDPIQIGNAICQKSSKHDTLA